MADKQIVDYSSGSYSPNDVLLRQPSAGGIYQKVNLPSLLGYNVYSALLTQTGTNAPVPTVLQNTLGGSIVWARSSQGIFTGTLAGTFTVGKTLFVALNPEGITTGAFILHSFHTDVNEIGYFGYDDAWNLTDDTSCSLEIRVYP